MKGIVVSLFIPLSRDGEKIISTAQHNEVFVTSRKKVGITKYLQRLWGKQDK